MSNSLNQFMRERHGDLLKQWFEIAIAAYSAESHKYFVKVNNEFTNPVGSNIYRSMDHLLTELSGDRDADRLYGHLEMILKIRAVQDMKPSKASTINTIAIAMIAWNKSEYLFKKSILR